MPPVTDEQLRLFATYLNIVAAGALVASLITEPFSWALAGGPRPWTEGLFAFISFALSIAFHTAAQLVLGRLRNNEP